jgi:hypothetical protein
VIEYLQRHFTVTDEIKPVHPVNPMTENRFNLSTSVVPVIANVTANDMVNG